MTYAVREARREELALVLGVQRRAFERVARELGIRGDDLPPLQESLADLEALMDAGTRFFIAVGDAGRILGSVRGRVTRAATSTTVSTVEVGRLVVDDDCVRLGIGTALMDALESSYPEATRFELFTGAQASAPMALYLKRGYAESRRENLGYVELVWLEKLTDTA